MVGYYACGAFISPYKSPSGWIWPYHKTGQDQSRVIIWINLKGPDPPMLHTKFQGHRPFVSWAVSVMWPIKLSGLFFSLSLITQFLIFPHNVQTLVPLPHRSSTCSLVSTSQPVLETSWNVDMLTILNIFCSVELKIWVRLFSILHAPTTSLKLEE